MESSEVLKCSSSTPREALPCVAVRRSAAHEPQRFKGFEDASWCLLDSLHAFPAVLTVEDCGGAASRMLLR